MGQYWECDEIRAKAPNEWECPLDIGGTVEQLLEEIETEDIPEDYEPYGHYRQVLADIRHNYTDYQMLLERLPHCLMLWAECKLECPYFEWSTQSENCTQECYHQEWAHDTLKWATKDAAKTIYDEWLTQKKEEERSD